MKKDSILVIGGTGFLGINLLNNLSSKNYNLYSLSKSKKNNLRKVKHFKCDLTKKNQAKILSNYEFNYVINFLGNIDHKDKKQNFQVHLAGLKNLYKALNKNYLNLFIQIGSCLEYGKLKSPQKEKIKSNPFSIYGTAKYLASKFIKKKLRSKSLILRLYQVYGPHQKNDRLVPYVIKSCKKDFSFKCTEGKQNRDFLYVDDFTNLIIKILKHKKNPSGIYNIGYGRPKKVKNIINKISNYIGKGKPQFGAIKMRKDEIESLYPDISKVKKKFKWRPKTDIDTGLIKTIKYYEKKII